MAEGVQEITLTNPIDLTFKVDSHLSTGSGLWGSNPLFTCPHCGKAVVEVVGGSMGHKGDHYEWRTAVQCPKCGWRREEVTSLPLSRVYGKEA